MTNTTSITDLELMYDSDTVEGEHSIPLHAAGVVGMYARASVSAEGEREGRHATYRLRLVIDDSDERHAEAFDGPSPAITFQGEIEREAAVKALRWMADELELMGTSYGRLREVYPQPNSPAVTDEIVEAFCTALSACPSHEGERCHLGCVRAIGMADPEVFPADLAMRALERSLWSFAVRVDSGLISRSPVGVKRRATKTHTKPVAIVDGPTRAREATS